MKIKEGYILKSVAGSNVIVPVSNPHFKAIISVNDTGAFIFNQLKDEKNEKELTCAVINEYEIDEKTAAEDVKLYVEALSKAGLLDE